MTNITFELTEEKSSNFILTDGFMDALFSISENIHKKEKFKERSNGSSRLIWHITKADLMLMCTLHVCFNSNGELENVSRHQIYQKLLSLYEDPCCDDQFYIAFDKFLRLGFITELQDGIRSEFKLNHFIDVATNKISRMVVMNPFVFKKQFTDLPIAAQKLVFDIIRKTGNNKKNDAFYWLNKGSGILKQLHKTYVYELKNIVHILADLKIDGISLLKFWHIDNQRGTRMPKLTMKLNPSFTEEYVKGTPYRQVLPGRKLNRRIVMHLRDLLASNLIGDFEYHNEGKDFYLLATKLKNKSRRFIKYIVEKIREVYELERKFPADIINLIAFELKHKTMSEIIDISKRTGIYKFISPRKYDENRLFEFASAASSYGKREFEKLCKSAFPVLEKHFTIVPAHHTKQYEYSNLLHLFIDAETLRSDALLQQKSPEAYKRLEAYAEDKLEKDKEDPMTVRKWIQGQIDLLPKWTNIADIPIGFKIEDYILNKIKYEDLPFFK